MANQDLSPTQKDTLRINRFLSAFIVTLLLVVVVILWDPCNSSKHKRPKKEKDVQPTSKVYVGFLYYASIFLI